jgi:hypothetical protein
MGNRQWGFSFNRLFFTENRRNDLLYRISYKKAGLRSIFVLSTRRKYPLKAKNKILEKPKNPKTSPDPKKPKNPEVLKNQPNSTPKP